MSQVQEVVRDALGHLNVIDANEAIKAIDMRDAIRSLNLMMTRWEANGMSMGWQNVEKPDDTLPAPPEAEQAIGYNLALMMRARYNATLAPDVVGLAQAGLAELRRDVAVANPLKVQHTYRGYNIRTGDYF